MSSLFDLRDLGPRLVTFLDKPERLALRAACREGRVVVDRDTTSLENSCASWYWDGRFAAFMNGMLSRGSRPTRLVLTRGEALAVLALFVQHQQMAPQQQHSILPAPSLTHLYLRDIPFTDVLASAVRSAAPHLASLDIEYYREVRGVREVVPGLCNLLTTCASSLTSLTFDRRILAFVPQPLANAISACTRLQHLGIALAAHYVPAHYVPEDSDEEDADDPPSSMEKQLAVRLERMFNAMHALPSLRSLDLIIPGDLEQPSAVAAAIGSLTQLTSLKLAAELSLPVVRPLRNLARLTYHPYGDAGARLADVQPLSQLTYLVLDSKDKYSPAADVDGCTGLPASLRELHLDCHPTARQMQHLLQLGPGLTRLSFGGIMIPVNEGRTPPAAAAGGSGGAGASDGAGAGAAGEGVSSSGPGSGISEEEGPGQADSGALDELLQAVGLLHGRWDGSKALHIQLADDGSPGGRSLYARDGYVQLFAALRPLRLRKLELLNCALELPDVLALVKELPWLEDLTLECEARPAALTPLAGLPRLENLRVILQPGDDAAAWSADSVAAVFMSVVLNAPAIRQIRIRPWRVLHNHKWLDAAIEKGVEHMQAFLRQVERNPALVELERYF